MSGHVVIETSVDNSRRLGCYVYISDFANILKSFVGSNFLSIPFGFGLCGMAIGSAGLILIGALTIHCCHLLVKCKYHAIQHIVQLYQHPNDFSENMAGYRKRKFFVDHLIDPEVTKQKGNADQRKDDVTEVKKRLVKRMQYGDLARICFGQWGVAVTTVFVLVTQVGFCINYSIFTATAIRSFFPLHNCTVQLQRNSSIISSDCQHLADHPWQPWLEEAMNRSRTNKMSSVYVTATEDLSTSDSVQRSDGYLTSQDHSASSVILNSNNSLNQKQSPSAQLDFDSYPDLSTISLPSSSSSLTENLVAPFSRSNSIPQDSVISAENSTNVGSDQITPPADLSSNVRNGEDSSESVSVGQSVWNLIWTDSPDIRLLFLIPVFIFGILVLPKQVRGLGIISTLGNVSLLSGTLVVLITLIAQFHISDSWVWEHIEGLPIFLGTVAGAFEGTALMLPVEGSMEGNRHNYAPYLAGGITMLVSLHLCMSVLSYLAFGSAIQQVVTMNLDVGSWLGVTLNAFLMVGIIFTFPLMVIPVVQMAETTFLEKGCYCCRTRENAEDKSLLAADPHSTADPTAILQVSRWKRNVVRITIVLFIVMLSVFLRDSFAYVAAFVGAVGSTFVAFVLPCLFHLRLCWPDLSLCLKIKDLSIVLLGVVSSVSGVYSVVKDGF